MPLDLCDLQQEENVIEKLVVKYDGEALQRHKIDLEVLTESLNGLNSLLKEVNLVINGTKENISIDVEPFREGSFEYLIDVIQNPTDHLNILSIIGLGGPAILAAGHTLIELIRRINVRAICRLVLTAEGNCKIILEDGTEIIAPSYFKLLLASKSIRKSLSKLIHNPLQKAGYELFKVSTSNGIELVSVNKNESEPFKYRRASVEQSLSERTLEKVLITFLTIHKDKNNGWRIHYESEPPITASINDTSFFERVISGREPGIFSDAYRVDLLVRENLNSLEKTYIVVKVYDTL